MLKNQTSNLIIWVDPVGIRFGTWKVRRLNQALESSQRKPNYPIKVSIKVKEDGFIPSCLNQGNLMVNVLYLPLEKLILKL